MRRLFPILTLVGACTGKGGLGLDTGTPAADDSLPADTGVDSPGESAAETGAPDSGAPDDTGDTGVPPEGACSGGAGWAPGITLEAFSGMPALVYVPEGLPACAPLVIFGHGASMPGGLVEDRWTDLLHTDLQALAAVRGFALLVPGVQEEPDAQHEWSTSCARQMDVAIGELSAGLDLDGDRVWYMGQSAGAFMGVYYGLEDPSLVRAIGSVSGGLTFDYPSPDPDPRLPFYVVHDPEDQVVDYAYSEALVEALEAHGHAYRFEDWSLGNRGHSWADGLSEALLDGFAALQAEGR